MCKHCYNLEYYPLPQRRSFSRPLKHISRRKATAATRINVNRFWNEMEEFNERRTEEYLDLDTYTCDLEVQEVFVAASSKLAGSQQDDWEQDSAYDSFNSSCSPDSLCECSVASPLVPSPAESPVHPSYHQFDLPSPPPSMPAEDFSLPSPPSFTRTKHFLDMINSMSSFSLCTAV